MAEPDDDVEWETCLTRGCIGVRLQRNALCLAHADPHVREAALAKLGDYEELDLQGLTFDGELLRQVLAALPVDDSERVTLRRAKFSRATFVGPVGFLHTVRHPTPRSHDLRFVGDADFSDATFQGGVVFAGAQFDGDVTFRRAVFERDIRFDAVTVRGDVDFRDASFRGDAVFTGAKLPSVVRFEGVSFEEVATFAGAHIGSGHFERVTFRDEADFLKVEMEGASFIGVGFEGQARFDEATLASARFDRATFADEARFVQATFNHDAVFDGVTFDGPASFVRATFEGDAWFVRTMFRDHAGLYDTTFRHAAKFNRVDFTSLQLLGPLLVDDRLWLEDAVFRDRATIRVSAAEVTCRRARFLAGVHLQVGWAEVTLDDAELSAPSILNAARGLDRPLHRPDLDEGDERTAQPRVMSMQRANVAGLTLAGVDLHACRFAGAHHLDQLRMDECDFGTTPAAWSRTNRQAIAEEHHWRAAHHLAAGGTDRGWYGDEYWPIVWSDADPSPPTAAQVAAIYRDLRKQREDNKDEPGAADFYYGEMEMRRHATGRRTRKERMNGRRRPAVVGEHWILVLYWLVSGYGLRAWRATASLIAVVLVASVALALWGFGAPGVQPVDVAADGTAIYADVPRPSGLDELPTSLRVSAQASTALLRGPDVKLNGFGEGLHLALRLIGPVLLGLAVLSIRGRVKR